jgi:hypothetical protein
MDENENILSYDTPSRLRPAGQKVMRWLAGSAPVAWRRSAAWYLRLLGLIYLAAFISLWVQIEGLIGSHGILPIQQYLASVRMQLGNGWWWQVPTLCWFNSADWFLQFQCGAGAVLAILAALGIAQMPAFALLWLLYLSLTTAGQTFLGYQWDGLLLEAGLLAIFLSPLRWLAWKPRWAGPPIVVMWLQRWLIFRLMFLSGVVKLASGDPTWRNLTALTYHYWTQPIPTWTSYYASHWPLGFQKFSACGMFVVELGLPLLMFGPRRLRTLAAIGVVTLQLLILGTGNYGFFNLLATALCVPLLDDSMLPRLWPRGALDGVLFPSPGTPGEGQGGGELGETRSRNVYLSKAIQPPSQPSPGVPGEGEIAGTRAAKMRLAITGMLAAVILIATGTEFAHTCGVSLMPAPFELVAQTLSPLRSTNSYGLFAVMTTERPELIFEGSNDRVTWTEYRFKWKAGDLKKRPTFCTPHMPRLDWQLWFAALNPQGNSAVIDGLVRELLRGSKPVGSLMDGDPFAGRPPRFIRVKLYQYRFTTASDGKRTGDWWERTDTGQETEAYTLGTVGATDSSGE